MDIYMASEVAYKNGYEAGIKEFAERLKKGALVDSGFEVLQLGTIDNLAKELTKNDAEG